MSSGVDFKKIKGSVNHSCSESKAEVLHPKQELLMLLSLKPEAYFGLQMSLSLPQTARTLQMY